MNSSIHRRGVTLWGATLLLAVLAATAAPCAFAATGSGHPVSEARQVSDFQAISAFGPIKLVVRQAAREALELRADDNLLPLIETTVEAGTLRIAPKRGENLNTRTPIIATIDVVNLKSLLLSGSGDVLVDTLKTPALSLILSGSSDARLRGLATDELGVKVSGSGNVEAAGSAARLKISVSGSGDARTRELTSDDVTISIAGSGSANVTANKTLSVSIAGSGDVVFGGTGALVKSSIAGSGSVKQRQ